MLSVFFSQVGYVRPSDLSLECIDCCRSLVLVSDLWSPVLSCSVVDDFNLCELIHACRVLSTRDSSLVPIRNISLQVLAQERHLVFWVDCRFFEFTNEVVLHLHVVVHPRMPEDLVELQVDAIVMVCPPSSR